MSGLAVLDTVTAVEVLPLCPSCGDHFRDATAPESMPNSLPCGHVLCFQCADAISLMSEPQCVLCQRDVSAGLVENLAFAAFAEEMLAAHEAGTQEEGASVSGAEEPAKPAVLGTTAWHSAATYHHFV